MTTEAPPIDRRPGLDRLRGFAAALVDEDNPSAA
jgi:hypothetical protein